MPATAEINSGPASHQTPNTMALFGVSSGLPGCLGITLSGVVTDLDPGHGFPTGIRYVDLYATAEGAVLDGLPPGLQGQRITARNVCDQIIGLNFNTGVLLPSGEAIDLVYYQSWTIDASCNQ